MESEILLRVDHSCSLYSITKKSKYCLINISDSIAKKIFPINPDLSGDVKAKIFHFDKIMTSEQVIIEMKKDGWIPAEAPHLFAFSLFSNIPAIALGSTEKHPFNCNRPCVFVFNNMDGERRIWLNFSDQGWASHCNFLAVQAPSF